MARTIKLDLVLPASSADKNKRAGKLIEALIDHVIPKMSAAMTLPEDEVLARLLIELGHIVGITHSAESALAMVNALTEAILQGREAALEAALETAGCLGDDHTPSDEDSESLPEWATQCSSVAH